MISKLEHYKPRMEDACTLPGNTNESVFFESKVHAHIVSEKLQTFYEEEEFFDIVLIADNDKTHLSAHRIVLSASSEYFLAMFRSGLNEAKAVQVTIKDIDGKTLKTLLNFIYTGCIELRCETVETILKAAGFFQINTLVGACCDFIEQSLDTTNCLGIATFAEQHSYRELNQYATAFALRNFEKVSNENEFFQLNKDQLCELISSDELNVSSEEKVFLSAVAWMEYDKSNREEHILEILSMVRFTSLEQKFIIENRNSVCKTIECCELIRSWLQWHLTPEKPQQRTLKNIEPRKHGKRKLAFISGHTSNDLKLQTFDRDSETWSYITIPQLNVVKSDYMITYINNKLIITGGDVDFEATNSVECFNLLTHEWTNLSPMGSSRLNHEAKGFDGHLYVLGGCGTGRSVEKYDFATDCWQYLQSLPPGFEEVNATVLRGHLYAIYKNEVISYSAADNKWVKRYGKKSDLVCPGYAAVCGKLYSVAGTGSNDCEISRTLECYNLYTDDWEAKKSLQFKRNFMYCTDFEDRLIVAGGYVSETDNFTGLVEEYDPETNKWTELAYLLQHSVREYCNLLFTF